MSDDASSWSMDRPRSGDTTPRLGSPMQEDRLTPIPDVSREVEIGPQVNPFPWPGDGLESNSEVTTLNSRVHHSSLMK